MTEKVGNPMRWDCDQRGCFNKKKRPKIEMFKDALPGKINFGDVDAIVEISSRFLMLEWKPSMGELQTGQRLLFERLTLCAPLHVFVIAGDAETMEVQGLRIVAGGKFAEWRSANFDDVLGNIERWAAWAKSGKGRDA